MPLSRFARLLTRAASETTPGLFTLVMSTGIVSLACQATGMGRLAIALYALNAFSYVLLLALTLLGIGRAPLHFFRSLMDSRSVYRLLPLVAATSVLGMQTLLQGGGTPLATLLWGVALGLWLVLIYVLFFALMIGPQKASFEHLHGGWLMAVVATQSVSILGSNLAPRLDLPSGGMLIPLSLFLFGCVLYLLLIPWILQSLLFYRVTADALTPLNWINMGACAITVLAGSSLLADLALWPLLAQLGHFLLGISLLFWVLATWWIPLLIMLGIWRHGVRRFPLAYDPSYWGLVFPLGMYSLSTLRLGESSGIGLMSQIPQFTIIAALLAWSVTMTGALRYLYRETSEALRAQ